MTDERWMAEALRVAAAGLERGELPIGAVVVLEDRVIAAAHTAEVREGRYLVHAEYLALDTADQLRPFPGRRRDCRLYSNLEPCLMCLGAAMSFFAGSVCYALESPGDGACRLLGDWRRDEALFPAYRSPAVRGGVLRAESLSLFREYVRRRSAVDPTGPMLRWAADLVAAAERTARSERSR